MIGLACLGEPHKWGVFKAGPWPFVLLWIIANCIGSSMVCQQYSREDLFRLGLRCTDVVPDVTALRKLGIGATATHRGCRGSGHKRPIPTVSIHRHSYEEPTGIHKSNLTYVNCRSEHLNNIPKVRKPLHVSLINARSVKNKASEIAEFITDNDTDVCAITETWLSSGERDSIA